LTALRPVDAVGQEQARRRELIDRAQLRLRNSPAHELTLAADAFIIAPPREASATQPSSDVPHTSIIAGYHWFTDWGRDTMISLEGLTLLTGRHDEACGILRTFSKHVRDGLIPNFFSEHEGRGLYHTADATLWFFHALDRYLELTGDRDTLRELLPKLIDVVEHHRQGTEFGIAVDPRDGLLRQGAEGYQLTWMDAKVGDWVVTPRRGKAVEINALWYNALQLVAQWLRELQYTGPTPPLSQMADSARASFNDRFWYAEGGYLYDVVDGERGDDASCRPNQVFAISLRHPVLDQRRWQSVLEVVQQRLLTPVGLRSLSPEHPDYKPQYHGDLRSRDAAYHQGTVWAWLIGPFVDAWIKLHPERRSEARGFLAGFVPHLDEACIGTISEIFEPSRHSPHEVVWRKRGAWPKFCGPGGTRPTDRASWPRPASAPLKAVPGQPLKRGSAFLRQTVPRRSGAPGLSRDVDHAGQHGRFLRATGDEAAIEHERRHAIDAESMCAGVVAVDDGEVRVAAQVRPQKGHVEVEVAADLSEHTHVADISATHEMVVEQRLHHPIGSTVQSGEADQTVGVDGVRRAANTIEGEIDFDGLAHVGDRHVDTADARFAPELADEVSRVVDALRRQIRIE
jgi:hypothetical protein